MKLRYAGSCRICGVALAAGETAIYHREPKQVECLTCFGDGAATGQREEATTAAAMPALPAEDPSTRDAVEDVTRAVVSERGVTPPPGTAGASARREHERRVA